MRKLVLAPLAMLTLLAGCGSDYQSLSQPEWQQSRPGSSRYAYLWESDLQDEFLFGVNVIEVDDFLGNALNMSVRPTKVRLALEDGKLAVKTVEDGESIFKFDVREDGGRHEVDFASAGNDLELRGLIDVLGGIFTSSNTNGFWLSEDAPTVRDISQDNDTVVVDLLHTVSQVILGYDLFGRPYIRQRISEHPGKVLVRLWLKRQKSLPSLPASLRKTVADAQAQNLGFFASDWMADDPNPLPIQRFPIGLDGSHGSERVVFYLKNFPSEFVEAGKQAVASWNDAFGGAPIFEARVAPENIDAGDPRYHVIKWYDGLDEAVGWAGVAKMMTDPDTGLVMAGGVYVQGGSLVTALKEIADFTQTAARQPIAPTGRIGQVDFSLDEGESPIIPFFASGQAPDEYAHSYYVETITHEVGHVLGLRHNFKGSVLLNEALQSASIMDYTPRSAPALNPGPGVYDKAAVRWAYFGESNDSSLPFCTDEDLDSQWDCNQGDYGDPVEHTIRSLVDGTNLLTQLTVEITEDRLISSMKGTVQRAQKLWSLRASMPQEVRADLEQKLPVAIRYVNEAQPAESLSEAERQIAQKNLDRLRNLLQSAE